MLRSISYQLLKWPPEHPAAECVKTFTLRQQHTGTASKQPGLSPSPTLNTLAISVVAFPGQGPGSVIDGTLLEFHQCFMTKQGAD